MLEKLRSVELKAVNTYIKLTDSHRIQSTMEINDLIINIIEVSKKTSVVILDYS